MDPFSQKFYSPIHDNFGLNVGLKNFVTCEHSLTHLPMSLQGPALYAFNDARFTDADWTGIRMLSQSVKQPDRFKVGYFGMGFKSVFHITGTHVYFF